MVHPYLFETLKQRNPKVKKVLYLYDKIDGHFQINSFFPYYDRVFSFDKVDCKKYNLRFLPIYWFPAEKEEDIIFDILNLASLRYESQDKLLYLKVKKIAKENNLRDYIKLFYKISQNKYIYTKISNIEGFGEKEFSLNELRVTIFLFLIQLIHPSFAK